MHLSDIEQLDFKEKKVKNYFTEIEKSKDVKLSNFIYSLFNILLL